MITDPSVQQRARRLVLENAVTHGGSARPGPVVARLLASDPTLRAQATDVQELVTATLREVGAMSADAQREALEKLGGPEPTSTPSRHPEAPELPELPGAVSGQVVLRMAPFPSGTLHIGNARMVFLNDYYRRRYAGRLLLVFDDTVGTEEKRVDAELFDLIRADLEHAEVKLDAVYYKSDRVPLFYPWARRVIDRGGAYVCFCPADRLRENRRASIACPERGQSTGETVDLWQRMLDGGYREGEAVLRLRTDLSDPDPAFRDRVLFRISELDHPRVGRRYRVWPLLEFSWAVDDIELGITHVLRGKDLVMEDRMQRYIWSLLGLIGPPFVHWGLLRVREAKLSKSKSYREVKSGEYDGWADPRTWSLASLERRGISMRAVREFTLSFGMSLADIEVPAETLYAENRSILDPTTPRRFFVSDPVGIRVRGYPEGLQSVEMANHPDRPELGKRMVKAGSDFWLARADVLPRLGEEVRLKDLLNIRLPAALPGSDGLPMDVEFTSRENRRLPRLQWVGTDGAVEVDLLDPDGKHQRGVAESALRTTPPGAVYQFERVGFVRIESTWSPGTSPVRVCFGHP